jgi:ATP-dependent exoDNAse (exonuclease V) alpha subunit
MAIYRLSADIVRRSEGRTVTAAAAYRAGMAIIDQRTGLTFDYSRRHGVLDTEILAPADVPLWIFDRVQLWNQVEACEKRKDAQLARDIELALPHELEHFTRRELVHGFVRAAFVDAGMVADIALHAPDAAGDGRNHHAHILLTLRRIEGESFGPKVRAWNDKAMIEHWRALWAEHVNQALELAGETARVDHRSLEAQGIERVPQIHLGLAVTEMRRRGVIGERVQLAQEITATNAALLTVELPKPMPAPDLYRPAFHAVTAPLCARRQRQARHPIRILFRQLARKLAGYDWRRVPRPRSCRIARSVEASTPS